MIIIQVITYERVYLARSPVERLCIFHILIWSASSLSGWISTVSNKTDMSSVRVITVRNKTDIMSSVRVMAYHKTWSYDELTNPVYLLLLKLVQGIPLEGYKSQNISYTYIMLDNCSGKSVCPTCLIRISVKWQFTLQWQYWFCARHLESAAMMKCRLIAKSSAIKEGKMAERHGCFLETHVQMHLCTKEHYLS